MFNTFNMGVGMIIAVAKEDADKALEVLAANGEDAVVLGEVISGCLLYTSSKYLVVFLLG